MKMSRKQLHLQIWRLEENLWAEDINLRVFCIRRISTFRGWEKEDKFSRRLKRSIQWSKLQKIKRVWSDKTLR